MESLTAKKQAQAEQQQKEMDEKMAAAREQMHQSKNWREKAANSASALSHELLTASNRQQREAKVALCAAMS